MKKIALVLAGGGGTRLKPLSTPETPKQFLKLFSNRTLFRETLDRIKGFDRIIIVANQSMENLIKIDIKSLKNVDCIWEPSRKNTGPAVALAANQCDPNDIIVMFPCDHFIQNDNEFNDAIQKAITQAENGYIVSISTQPSFVSDQFGYVFGNNFVEKPNIEKALELINKGYQWNTGIYAFRVRNFQNVLLHTHPEVQICATEKDFNMCPQISFDKAISEKCNTITNVPSNFYWSDIGTFKGLYEVISDTSPKNLEYSERPWGSYQVLRDDNIYKMKLLTIKAGEGISLQYHNHRTEIWYILQGKGTFVNQKFDVDNPLENSPRYYRINDTIEIPVRNIHQITAETETKVFEVQIGHSFEESDIIRILDKYNRE